MKFWLYDVSQANCKQNEIRRRTIQQATSFESLIISTNKYPEFTENYI